MTRWGASLRAFLGHFNSHNPMDVNLRELWAKVLTRIEPTITRTHFVTWFNHTIITSIGEKNGKTNVVVGVPTIFAKDWVAGKYGIKVLQALKEIMPDVEEVEFEIINRLADKVNTEGIDASKISPKDVKKIQKTRDGSGDVYVKSGVKSKALNPRYTLENFVAGKDNRLPHAAAMAVSSMPGGIYNPMYIYGGCGLGKTHLLQAIGNAILARFPEKVIRYVTSERFVSEVCDSISKREMGKFKESYRKVDVLLIDDVQFFGKKDSSQQEFFHTFNELYETNKQIVLTSDRPPSELDDLDKRLTTRFSMGMVTEILFPDFETKVAILQEKCQEMQIIIDPEVLQFIAGNVNTNVRELEGVLRQVVAEAQLENRVPTVRSAAEVFKKLYRAKEIIGYDIKNKDEKVSMTAKEVMEAVSSYYRITVDDLMSEIRKKEFLIPRQVCMYIIRHELEESYERIGQDFGGKKHTTVMHACGQVLRKLKKDSRLVRDINAIKREIGL